MVWNSSGFDIPFLNSNIYGRKTHMKLRIFAPFVLIISCLMIISCGGPEERKMEFFNKGKALYEEGEFVKARLGDQKRPPDRPQVCNGLLYARGNRDEGTELAPCLWCINKALELDPDLTDAELALGNLLIAAKQVAEAREKAENVLSKDPENEKALLLKARCLLADQKVQEAEFILESLIQKNPKNTDPYIVLARSRVGQKDMAGGIKVLRDLLAQDEKNQLARIMLAGLLEKNNDLKGAEEEIQYNYTAESGK